MYPECLILSGIPSVYVTEDDTIRRAKTEDSALRRQFNVKCEASKKQEDIFILSYILQCVLTVISCNLLLMFK